MAPGVAALAVGGGDVGPAQELGAVGQGSVGDGIFHVVGHGFVVEVGGDVAVLHAEVLSAVRRSSGGGHGLDDFIVRETGAEAFHHGVGKGDEAGISYHAVRLIAHQVPYRQVSLLFVNVVEGGYDVVHLLRMDEGHQRLGGTVGVPEGEAGVILEVSFPDDVVVPAVLSVHVIEGRRGDHRVVEGGVEDGLGVGVVAPDGHFSELLVPGGTGFGLYGVEVPAGEFGLHVGAGACHGNGGEGDLDEHLLAFVGVAQVIAAVEGFADISAFAVVRGILGHGETFRRAGEFGPEEDFLILGPALGEAASADGVHLALLVAQDLEFSVGHVVPAAAVLQVEDKVRLLRSGEGIAVHAHA